jgi:sugar transferase (PEP-CTERM/EpsH1 system associated)
MPKKNGRAVPLIAHVIYRLDVGGLENGLVNLINRIPADRFRHAVICLKDYTDFRNRVRRTDVPIVALGKQAGHSPLVALRLWRIFSELRPDIVHTRNLAALEASLLAALAGVPVRIHGEHGRDVGDLEGANVKYQMWRRLFRPFVSHYIALSKDLERYLHEQIRVPRHKVVQLYNGVDTELFRPAVNGREPLPFSAFAEETAFVVGSVGRMQAVKDPVTLAKAFVLLRQMAPAGGRPLKLVMVGDGPLREQVAQVLAEGGAADVAWLCGERSDVPRIMRGLDVFVLPSLAEGISNTILEAMASGVPVIATAVGGNPELVRHGATGTLVNRSDPRALAQALLHYYLNEPERRQHGLQGRAVAERHFSLSEMVNRYLSLYDDMLSRQRLKGVSRCTS